MYEVKVCQIGSQKIYCNIHCGRIVTKQTSFDWTFSVFIIALRKDSAYLSLGLPQTRMIFDFGKYLITNFKTYKKQFVYITAIHSTDKQAQKLMWDG